MSDTIERAETAFEFQANIAQRAAKLLAHSLQNTQEDKLNWRPSCDESSKTRTVMEQVIECIRVNFRIGASLKGADAGDMAEEPTSIEEAVDQLLESGEYLSSAIRVQDYSLFERTFETPMGKLDGRTMITLPVANMYYHFGQISQIQLLYGDDNYYFPKE